MQFLCKICDSNVGAKLSAQQQQQQQAVPAAHAAVPCTSAAVDDQATAAAATAVGRCSFCLGLLDDDELHDKIVEETSRQLRREGHEAVSFVLALNVPMSALLREAVVERLVEPAWSQMSMSPKELLSRQLMSKISKATGLRPSLNSDLTITVTLENDEFVQSDFDFFVLHFSDEFLHAPASKRRRRGGAGGRTNNGNATTGKDAVPSAEDGTAATDMAPSLLTKMKIKTARDRMSRAVASTFNLTPAFRPCTCASVALERQPLFIAGRYCKYSRALPQSPWLGAADTDDAIAAVMTPPAYGDDDNGTMSVNGTASGNNGTASGNNGTASAEENGTAAEIVAAVVADSGDGTVAAAVSADADGAAATTASAISNDGTTTTTSVATDGTVPKSSPASVVVLPMFARHCPPQSSVSEKIAGALVRHFGADGSRFIAAGREDIDVRMLGTGRPFAVQLLNARKTACLRTRASAVAALAALTAQINASEERTRDISVRALAHVSAKQVQQLNAGQEEKRKTYSALCCTRTPLAADGVPLRALHAHAFPLRVAQRTVVRVLKRRPLIDRTRFVYAMRAVVLDAHHFVLRLETQAGTYVKEFVHSDFGRTRPSVGELMGLAPGQVDIVRLDVLSVDMAWPPPASAAEEQQQQKMDGDGAGGGPKEEEGKEEAKHKLVEEEKLANE